MDEEKDTFEELHKSQESLRNIIRDRNEAFKDLDRQVRDDKKKKIDQKFRGFTMHPKEEDSE